MEAVWYERTGPAREVLVHGEMPAPEPGPGEVLVRLAASGVNPSDVKARAGARGGASGMPFPRIVPHSDGSGTVAAVGPGVPEARVGERVWIWNGQWRRPFGTAAAMIALPAAQAVPLPGGVSFEVGAGLGIPAMTAAHCVLAAGCAGRRVLVSGGAGTVGHLAVQFARRAGARVVATARGEGIARARAAGAHAVVDFDAEGLAERVREAAGGPVERAIEVEFGANADLLAAVLAERGRIVAYGSAAAQRPHLPFYPLLFKGISLDFALVYLLDPAEREAAVAEVTAALGDGLDVAVDRVLPLGRAVEAHETVERGGRAGAVVLRPD